MKMIKQPTIPPMPKRPTFDARDTQYNLPIGTDCISRQAAIDALAAMPCKTDEDGYIWIVRFDAWVRIDALPPAEPKRGKWIRDGHHIRCNQCGTYICDTDREGDRIPTDFCPNCGAKMEVNNESN